MRTTSPWHAPQPQQINTNTNSNKEQHTMNNTDTLRNDLIDVLKNSFSFGRRDLNVVLDACSLEEIVETVNITATYTVTVTWQDVPLSDDKEADDLDEYDLENLLDAEGLYPVCDQADDIEFRDAEID